MVRLLFGHGVLGVGPFEPRLDSEKKEGYFETHRLLLAASLKVAADHMPSLQAMPAPRVHEVCPDPFHLRPIRSRQNDIKPVALQFVLHTDSNSCPPSGPCRSCREAS